METLMEENLKSSQIFMGVLSYQMILNINTTIYRFDSTEENKLPILGWECIANFRPPGCHLAGSQSISKNECYFLF